VQLFAIPEHFMNDEGKTMSAKLAMGLLLVVAMWGAHAACPTTQDRYVAAGAEVTDSKTGLVWARCSVGQTWSGSACTGVATSITHEAALAYAQGQSGWRLPNVKELTSLADTGCVNPAMNSTAFPNTAFTWYWTSSPNAAGGNYAWGVYSSNGDVGNFNHNESGHVRLVRASQ